MSRNHEGRGTEFDPGANGANGFLKHERLYQKNGNWIRLLYELKHKEKLAKYANLL